MPHLFGEADQQVGHHPVAAVEPGCVGPLEAAQPGVRARRHRLVGRPRTPPTGAGPDDGTDQPLLTGIHGGGQRRRGGGHGRPVAQRDLRGGDQRGAAREAAGGVLGHAAQHERVESRGDRRGEHRRRRRRRQQVPGHHGGRLATRMGQAAGEALEQHAGQGVLIGSPVHRATRQPLRSQVVPRAQHRARTGQRRRIRGGGKRDAEVGQIGVVVRVDQDVRRLHVAVHQARGMSGVQRGRDLAEQRHGTFRGEQARAQQPPQVAALDQHHVQVELPVDLPEVVHRHRVRMHEPGREPCLPPEPGPEALVDPGLRQPFQRDRAPVLGVVSPVDGAHPAAAEQLMNAIAAEHGRGDIDSCRGDPVHEPPSTTCAGDLHPTGCSAYGWPTERDQKLTGATKLGGRPPGRRATLAVSPTCSSHRSSGAAVWAPGCCATSSPRPATPAARTWRWTRAARSTAPAPTPVPARRSCAPPEPGSAWSSCAGGSICPPTRSGCVTSRPSHGGPHGPTGSCSGPGPTPAEHLDDLAVLIGRMSTDAPMGDLTDGAATLGRRPGARARRRGGAQRRALGGHRRAGPRRAPRRVHRGVHVRGAGRLREPGRHARRPGPPQAGTTAAISAAASGP